MQRCAKVYIPKNKTYIHTALKKVLYLQHNN